MTKEETADLILMNATLYKQMMKPLTDEEMEATINEWTYQFKDYPGEVVKKAYLARAASASIRSRSRISSNSFPRALTRRWSGTL